MKAVAAGRSPLIVPSLRALWIADDLSAVGDGGAVTTWTDRINGFAPTQPTAGYKPTYRATGGPNSRPSVQCDGGDILTLATASPVSTASSGCVIVVGSGNSGAFWSSARNTGAINYMVGVVVTGQLRMQSHEGGPVGADISYATSPTGNNIIEWASSGSAWSIRINNAVQSLSQNGGSNNGRWFSGVTSRDRFAIGGLSYNGTANNFLTGHIAALIVIDAPLVGAARTNLYRYLSAKYAIAVS